MKMYLVSLAAGLLVGAIYGVLGVRSPAPPIIALTGLLGILMGEQIVPLGKRLMAGMTIGQAWQQENCSGHVFGDLPGRGTIGADSPRKGS